MYQAYAKVFHIQTYIKQLWTKYNFFTKLPKILQIKIYRIFKYNMVRFLLFSPVVNR